VNEKKNVFYQLILAKWKRRWYIIKRCC